MKHVAVRRTLALVALSLIAFAPVSAQQGGNVVSVLYAGSLVTPMEGPIKDALRAQGIDFQGEGGGSKKLANFIAAGIRNPDIFISVDSKLVTGLGPKVATAVTFAGTSLGVGWSDKSKYASVFGEITAGKTTVLAVLKTPGLRIGRTDPQVDPKGAYTIQAVSVLAGATGEKRLLGDDENNTQIFPEESLIARVDSGESDIGFFYKTEAVARGLHFSPLPGKAALNDKITYTVALMKNAPHPQQAKTFADFLLTGKGKSILEQAGIMYLAHPRVVAGRHSTGAAIAMKARRHA